MSVSREEQTTSISLHSETQPKHAFTLSRLCVDDSEDTLSLDTLNTVIDYSKENIPDFSPLQYVDINIQGLQNSIAGTIDSGAQICLCNRSLINSLDLPIVGSVKIKGIIGNAIDADLICLHIRLSNADDAAFIPIYCAVSNDVNDTFLITADAIRRLSQSSHESLTCRDDSQSDCKLDDCKIDMASLNIGEMSAHAPVDDDIEIADIVVLPSTIIDSDSQGVAGPNAMVLPNNSSDRSKLIQEQKDDATLSSCWKLAHNNKSGFHINNDLLFHQESIVGQTVDQLCVPKERRHSLMSLAHDLTHSSGKRLRQRLRYSFFLAYDET